MNWNDKINGSYDLESFLCFLSSLREDFLNNKESWENQSIDTYLESIIAWLNEYNGEDIDIKIPNWKAITSMFYMGKIYE